ncbi:MAG TPA: hypothetical protein VL334_10985, partial [Anaerolineae bacterium]|nr:hypothetical protein [Anaerolineae bacterium]
FILTASNDVTARVWEAATGAAVSTLSGHTTSVYSAAYSPDGQFIVTASDDGTARIWETATGAAVRTLSGHGCNEIGYCSVLSAAYSPDGKFIVTAGADRTARIWLTNVSDVLAKAQALIQRDPPLLTPEERRRYGLE